MNAKSHIFMSKSIVMTYTRGKHFQQLHIFLVHPYIYNTVGKKQINLNRVDFLHPITCLVPDATLFSWFQLDIMYTVFIFKKFKSGYHIIRSKLSYLFGHFLTTHWYHRIRYSRNELLFKIDYVIILHNKDIVETFDMKTFLMKCCILLND